MRQVLIIDCEVVTLTAPRDALVELMRAKYPEYKARALEEMQSVRQCELCHRVTPNVECPACAPGEGLARRFGHNAVAAVCRTMVPEDRLSGPLVGNVIYYFAARQPAIMTRQDIRERFGAVLRTVGIEERKHL